MHLSSNKKIKISNEQKFAAFEFNEADEFVEKFNRKKMSKFFKKTKKSTFNSPLDNYRFLQCFAGQAELAKSNSLFEPIDVDANDSKSEEPSWRLDKSGACNVSSDAKSDTKTERNYNSDVPFPIERIGVQSTERITRLDANVMSGLDTDVSRAKRSEDTICDYKNSNIDLNLLTVDTVPIRVDSDDDHSVENKLSVSGSNFARCEVAGQAELEKSNSVFEPIDVDASASKLEEPKCRLDEIGACYVSSDAKSDTKTAQNSNSDVPFSVEHIADKSAERITRLDANVMSGLDTDVSRAKRSEDTNRDYKNSNIDLNLLTVDTVPISVDSDDDCSAENEIPVSDSKFAGFEGLLGDDLSGVDVKEMTVFIDPDIIYYGDIYSMEGSLIFSSQGIRLEASTRFGTKRSIEVEWAVSEIFSIRSIRCGSLAEITLLFKSNDMKIAGVESKLLGSCSSFSLLIYFISRTFCFIFISLLDSGITKINFAVSDPNWVQTEKAIRSLNRRYKICWNAAFDSCMTSNEGSTSLSSSQISNHSPAKESNRVIVYPKGDPDAVSITKRDIELLLPERFINDTVIDFYIKYIVNKIRPPERQRFHFFNSFFFRKLADLDKDSPSVLEGTVSFQHVRKWTKKVDLFAKDFIFIPVNFSLHWSLIIICHPGEVTKSIDELHTANKLPCILHMDSIRGSHKGFGDLFQNYLLEEWKERHDIEADNISEKFGRLPFISLELPQQQNSFDCGLFLLHYVELFLEMTSVNSNAFNLAEPSNFPQNNWFPAAEASEKRVHIRKLIHGIFESDPLEDPELEADDKYPSSDFTCGNISTGSLLEKLDEREVASCADPEFISDQGVPVTSRKATPLKIRHRSLKSTHVLKDIHQEAQVVADKFFELSTIEEERETGGQTYPWTQGARFQRSVKVVDLFAIPHYPTSSVEHHNIQECEMFESPPETSTCLFPESENVVIDEDYVPLILVAPSPEKENHATDLELESHVIEDSDVEDSYVVEDSDIEDSYVIEDTDIED